VLVLLGAGFLAGLITALSPCVLPVLPILLAGGASGGRRRPYEIVAGLVASFTVFTLAAATLLDALGLPQDFLRDLAIALLLVLAATLLVPRLGHLLERPFAFLTRRRFGDAGGGLLLGASLGLVFVPCAGPVLAVVSVLVAREDVSLRLVLLTLAYALGAALPMLAIAIGGRRVGTSLRSRTRLLRPALGAVVAVTALAIARGADKRVQTTVPGYTEYVQGRIERSTAAERELDRLVGGERASETSVVGDYGQAPEFAGVARWLNTPGGRPLTMRGLRGKVVLIDFWTYSCVNCLRTLPYLRAWHRAYRDDGLVLVGVHSPEFAFEHVESNVREATGDLDVVWPVALDNDFDTWNAWRNRYWPSKYLVDRQGRVRYAHFGEGEYAETEHVIQQLLGEADSRVVAETIAGERAGRGVTYETYLGWRRINLVAGDQILADGAKTYRIADRVPRDHVSYGGYWRIEAERAVAGPGALLRLRFRARDVHLVLSGQGSVEVLLDGRRRRTVEVRGDRLYTLFRLPETREGLLELRPAPGVAAYAFTFG
jgi:cytochrome c biogenesis protein CcdA/thiol-disulfide isomerase/thioredoxin